LLFAEERTMKEIDIANYARQLFEQQGPKAIAFAAQRMREFQEKGEAAKADHWRRIEIALTEMRGPRET
jgi:hypothetical protein